MKRASKIVLSLVAGLAVGTAFAKLDFPGFKHATVMVGKGTAATPIFFDGSGGRQVLALSLKNRREAREIEVRMEGAEIQSWYPPVVRMPFNKGISFESGKFSGVEPGRRIPVYVVFDDDGRDRKIEVIDSADGFVIRTIEVLRGKDDEKHRH